MFSWSLTVKYFTVDQVFGAPFLASQEQQTAIPSLAATGTGLALVPETGAAGLASHPCVHTVLRTGQEKSIPSYYYPLSQVVSKVSILVSSSLNYPVQEEKVFLPRGQKGYKSTSSRERSYICIQHSSLSKSCGVAAEEVMERNPEISLLHQELLLSPLRGPL